MSQHLREYVHGQMRGVHRSVVEAAQGFHELVAMERPGFRQRFALDHFRKTRTGGNGGDATAGLETDLRDAAIGELDREFHDVTADGMLEAGFGVRMVEFADVARVLKMVEDFFRVRHALYLYVAALQTAQR